MLTTSLGPEAELCPLEPWQAAEFFAYTDRARAHLAPWLPWTGAVTDTASARRFLQRFADSQAADGPRIYGIRLSGELVGGMIFRLFDAAQGSCELGAWLAPEAQGRGLVTRAAGAMIDWAVGARGLSRVEWLVSPANGPSIAVAKRLGMTHEGTLRSVFEMDGKRHDLELWAVLEEEWRQRAGSHPHE
ncbi:GNAT family protein [Streptomyces sp. MP131-18]|uniref:GNAT family N-acetyltransferase n=1 Tax=Streptomyces sp. MP131-18 TaxID=1857892 RepID=UPI00097C7A79|nr:GNAT family protein [Streptomyces sp. MP131-18]ONK15662.1 putative ribosomal N-acetyltransferase YdaF [Streptomyces sp. MP131-18]